MQYIIKNTRIIHNSLIVDVEYNFNGEILNSSVSIFQPQTKEEIINAIETKAVQEYERKNNLTKMNELKIELNPEENIVKEITDEIKIADFIAIDEKFNPIIKEEEIIKE